MAKDDKYRHGPHGPDCKCEIHEIDLTKLPDEDLVALANIFKKVVEDSDPKRAFNAMVGFGIENATLDADDPIREILLDKGTDSMMLMIGGPNIAKDALAHACLMCIALMRQAFPGESTSDLLTRWNELSQRLTKRIEVKLDVEGPRA